MTAFDYAVLTIIVLSVGLGWWRGFVYELLSLLGWVAAYYVARLYAPEITRYVPDAVASVDARTAVAYAALFVVVLLVCGIAAWLFSKLVKLAGLGLADGAMGMLFGLLRGLLLVLVLVLLAGLTSLPQQPVWRDAWSSGVWQDAAVLSKDFLPENLAKKVNY